jgi:hypothetical protein
LAGKFSLRHAKTVATQSATHGGIALNLLLLLSVILSHIRQRRLSDVLLERVHILGDIPSPDIADAIGALKGKASGCRDIALSVVDRTSALLDAADAHLERVLCPSNHIGALAYIIQALILNPWSALTGKVIGILNIASCALYLVASLLEIGLGRLPIVHDLVDARELIAIERGDQLHPYRADKGYWRPVVPGRRYRQSSAEHTA